MKQQVQELGVRKWYGDDFIALQDELIKASQAAFEDLGNFIVNGCAITYSAPNFSMTEGIAFLKDSTGANGKLCRVYAITPSTTAAYYLVQASRDKTAVPAYGRTYKDSATKNIVVEYYAQALTSPPAHGNYITVNPSGTTRLRDALQNASYRFVTDTEKSTWNSKAAGTHTHAAADVTESSTKRFVTDTEKTTWNSKAAGTHTHAATDVTQDSTHRFATDAEKTAWNAKTTGPASATDNALVRFDGTGGKTVQNSAASLSDAGVLTVSDVVIS